jgi:hypothetical protein
MILGQIFHSIPLPTTSHLPLLHQHLAAAPILSPVYYAAPPVYHVPATAQPPVQYQPMHPSDPMLKPLPDNANNLYTSRTPADIDMEDSIEHCKVKRY